jgi:proton-coupled amino acid transporter
MSIPILALCSIRQLNALAPLAFAANIIYMIAVSTVIVYLLSDITSYQSSRLPAFGNWHNLPLFIGTVLFAFEGVAVVSY